MKQEYWYTSILREHLTKKCPADINEDVEKIRPCQLIISLHFFFFFTLTCLSLSSFNLLLYKMSTLLLPTPPLHTSLYRRNTLSSSSSSLQFHSRFSFSSFHSLPQTRSRRTCISLRAFDSSSDSKIEEKVVQEGEKVRIADEDYPSGEFEFEPITGWRNFVVKVKMLIAYPWERVRKGSVLTMKLRGQVSFYPFPLSHFLSFVE